ncbi:MAG: carbamoyltransferase HypF [Chloroflexi bacterium]|nr:carbamoyltransferase HypF [Chloroflexota bacterium]
MPSRLRVVVRGVVQGVGFRPHVYRLAQAYGLTGWVLNSTEGVVLEVEGTSTAAFLRDLSIKAPPQARIERVEVTRLPPVGYPAFSIQESEERESGLALVSPDVAICEDCRRELFDPANRRYRYPFINCTNCGPRFTIVQDIPYDRPKTTMRAFAMCPECEGEYHDPADRRFHAQPNACDRCGPQVELVAPRQTLTGEQAIQAARALLQDGRIVAVKGLGGFHLACDATDEEAVAELRRRKGRGEKPFAVMARDSATVERLCHADEDERHLLESPQRPIVLMRRRAGGPVAPAVAPHNAWLGVMLPYTPLHYLLLAGEMPAALVMTSGNHSEEPLAIDNEEARERLSGLADAFLWHDREIGVRCDDSVTRTFQGREMLLRRSRGYAPYPLRLESAKGQVLACGGELKNTFCLTRDGYAFLSHHVGDLENWETLRSFEAGVAHFRHLFRVAPKALAYDLHPDYLSTKYALGPAGEGKRLVGVQHHHAHVTSCLAENGLQGQVIGVAFDGTGYGSDGAVWGGEFLIASPASFQRVGQLAYVPLPGGAAAIARPCRTALSFAAAAGEWVGALALLRGHLHREGLPGLDRSEEEVLRRQVGGRLNSPATSSCGRLFDAVSALAGVRQAVNYEGQAAIELEMSVDARDTGAYHLPLMPVGQGFVLDHRPLIRAVLADAAAATPAGAIAARFHKGLAAAVLAGCQWVRRRHGLQRVALSGGVFQNTTLLTLCLILLENDAFKVYTQHQVPCNDGGLALGQALVANSLLET